MANDGFLGRWSRRKLSEDKAAEPPVPSSLPSASPSLTPTKPLASAPLPVSTSTSPSPSTGAPPTAVGARVHSPDQAGAAPAQSDRPETSEAPLPTLQDVQALTPESDFKPYLNKCVEPQVRNAAMKKLFADPRYNVMDRLDTYIDDYSQPDPIPESMLRKMVSAQFLGLFDEKKEAPAESQLRADADTPPLQSVAESPPVQQGQALADPSPSPVDNIASTNATDANPTAHAHTDLRLQPDDAPGPKEPERGAG